MIKFLKKYFTKNKISQYGICSICGLKFLDKDLALVGNLALCSSDHRLYKKNTWIKVSSGESDPSNPEMALKIQNDKDTLAQNNIPSYILVEYSEKEAKIISIFHLYIPQNNLSNFQDLKLT